MRNKNIKAVIFDFDGVIHDTFDLAYQINLNVLGEGLSKEEYRNLFNGNIYDHAKITKGVSDKFFVAQNEAFKYLRIEQDTKQMLEELSKQYPLFIITSNQEEALHIYFQNNNFTSIFKEIAGVEIHTSKVKKFKYLFQKYDLDSDECVFITDTLGDILEGHKANVKTIAVDFGFHGRERLEKGEPYKIVSSFDEMLEVIEKM